MQAVEAKRMTERLAAEPGITEGNKRFYRGLAAGGEAEDGTRPKLL